MLDLRLLPVVIFASSCLLALKIFGFVSGPEIPKPIARLDDGLWRTAEHLAGIERPPSADDLLITGATPDAKPAPGPAAPAAKGGAQAPSPGGGGAKGEPSLADRFNTPPATGGDAGPAQGAERALLERLQERRQELEARQRDLDLRENLIKAAEKRLEERIGELKDLEGTGEEASARMKAIVVMYESMGPKEAARIFDRLEGRTLVELVNNMNPRKVSEIMAKMQPAAAERLTLELARQRGEPEKNLPATDLPKIGANTR